MSMDELCWMDAYVVADLVRRREVSAVEVARAALARMDEVEPHIHAFCTPTPEAALGVAAAIDERIAAGEEVGPLAGVPVPVKDLLLTKGVRTTMGSVLYRDFIPDEDDIAVERLRAAGAVLLGKTNVSELGYRAHGRNRLFPATRNPWDPSLTPGGSSAGSAAAVAAGIAPCAIGSDGGGSIRIPASFCGVFGMKASMGRVPLYPGCRDDRYPGASSWESLEHVGPISRCVTDAALMLSVIAGPDRRDRLSLPRPEFDWIAATSGDVSGLRVAYSADLGFAAVDPEVRRVCDAAASVFTSDLGCAVEAADPPCGNVAMCFAALEALETDLTGLRALAAPVRGDLSPSLSHVLDRQWTAEAFTDAVTARKRVCRTMAEFFSRFDLLLTPALAVPPFPVEADGPLIIDGREVGPDDWAIFMLPMNLTGQPASVVPAGRTAEGLPVGLQIVGGHLDDPTVLRASAAFEAARPWRASRPLRNPS